MILEYIEAAMKTAVYEMLDGEGFYGEIPGFQGVYGSADTLELCRQELQSALEDWILFRVSQNLQLPRIGNLVLEIRKTA